MICGFGIQNVCHFICLEKLLMAPAGIVVLETARLRGSYISLNQAFKPLSVELPLNVSQVTQVLTEPQCAFVFRLVDVIL